MSKTQKKILFITHDCGYYGASRSLGLLLRNISGNFYLMFPKTVVKVYDRWNLSRQFNIPTERIIAMPLPQCDCYVGAPTTTTIQRATTKFKNARWKLNERRFRSWLKSMNFDFIHLNSLTLYPMISPEHKFILHVRERFQGNADNVRRTINDVSGIIFIDSVTQDRFRDVVTKPDIVIPNPIDMRGVRARAKVLALANTEIHLEGKIVFSMAGQINFSDKGVDFVIKCFKEYRNEDAVLLIFGSGRPDCEKKIRAIAKDDLRIHLCGAVADPTIIYSNIDVIIRGESHFALGRTVYEGLYSGSLALIPGAPEDLINIEDHEIFKDYIHFYTPRSRQSLLNKFQEIENFRNTGLRKNGENIEEYSERFFKYLEHI